MMAFDYSKLKGRIVEKYQTQQAFAKVIGLSERSLSLKLNNKKAWKQPEICRAINLLGLSNDDINEYFFKEKVKSF